MSKPFHGADEKAHNALRTPPVKSHLLTRMCQRPEASCEKVKIYLLHVDKQIVPRRAHAKPPLNPSPLRRTDIVA